MKIKYNVEGGQGTFVGGIVDTFNVYIKVDALTKSYSTPAVHAYACREDIGWGGNKDCRAYYRIYCQEKNWQPLDCGLDKIKYLLEQSLKAKIFDSIAVDFIQKIVLKDTSKVALKKEIATAENQVCGEQDFQLPDSTTVNVLAISSSKDSTGKISFDTVATPKINTRNICAEEKIACLETKGINDCKQSLWNFCLDRNWRPTQCNLGLVSYCREKPRLSEILCKNADAYCKEHPTETLCK